MHLNDFDFELPPDLLAQFPPPSREDARLMILNRREGSSGTGRFPDITGYFKAGDLLVVNDTRVIPARLLGVKESGGKVEVFLVRRLVSDKETWLCLTKCSKPPRVGSKVLLSGGIEGIIESLEGESFRRIRFNCDGEFLETLEKAGRIPLPPYIRREDGPLDRDRYQTVFASAPGAVAAPTAGLHFTEEIFRVLREKGVEIAPLTLHVGLGTFLPVRMDDPRHHRMHGELFRIPAETAAAVNRAKDEGRRVFALGTTTTRTLEHAADEYGRIREGEGETDLFIFPGYRFRTVDGLITNFHLPRSTLLMLVAAFAGWEMVLGAYRRAVAEKFRFFSYGDCMLIL